MGIQNEGASAPKNKSIMAILEKNQNILKAMKALKKVAMQHDEELKRKVVVRDFGRKRPYVVRACTDIADYMKKIKDFCGNTALAEQERQFIWYYWKNKAKGQRKWPFKLNAVKGKKFEKYLEATFKNIAGINTE